MEKKKENNETQQEPKAPKKKYSIKNIFGGDILVENFFIKQLRLIILIVIFLLIFISNRYSMIKKVVEIEELKRELTDIRFDNQTISTELIRYTRPAQIEQMLKERGIELIDPVEPAYEISK